MVTTESTPENVLMGVVVGCLHRNKGLHGVSIQVSEAWTLKQI